MGSTTRYYHKYGVGSTVYIKDEANKKGKLEAVHLKKINIVPHGNSYTGFGTTYNYVDTFNRVWLEHELVYLEDAIVLANNYFDRMGLPTTGSVTIGDQTFIVGQKEVIKPDSAVTVMAATHRHNFDILSSGSQMILSINDFVGDPRVFLNGQKLGPEDFEVLENKIQITRSIESGDVVIVESTAATEIFTPVDSSVFNHQTENNNNTFTIEQYNPGTVTVYFNGQRLEDKDVVEISPTEIQVLTEIRVGDDIIVDYEAADNC